MRQLAAVHRLVVREVHLARVVVLRRCTSRSRAACWSFCEKYHLHSVEPCSVRSTSASTRRSSSDFGVRAVGRAGRTARARRGRTRPRSPSPRASAAGGSGTAPSAGRRCRSARLQPRRRSRLSGSSVVLDVAASASTIGVVVVLALASISNVKSPVAARRCR